MVAVGAFLISDTDAEGYYVTWKGTPYPLQEDTVLTKYDPPQPVKAGMLVCDGFYYNPVPLAHPWYTQEDSASLLRAVICLQQVVAAGLVLVPISRSNPFPRSCDVRAASQK